MRRLLRIAAGLVLLGAAVIVAVPSPAAADHDSPNGTNWPCTSGDGFGPPAGCTGDAYHEEMPALAEASSADVCVVSGQVFPGTVTVRGPNHLARIPLVNENPSHSHFQFVQSVISCLGTGALTVDAGGGNDGHMIDILDNPPAVDTSPVELDPLTSNAPQHAFDDHHGATNESGWSNSSLYSGGTGGGSSNACISNQNQNKVDISIRYEYGWMKYIRLGTVLYAWGCFEPGGPISGANPFFSAVMVILPDLVPISAPPFLPGTGDPTCLVPDDAIPCGYVVVGVGLRGPGWLVDGEALPSVLP